MKVFFSRDKIKKLYPWFIAVFCFAGIVFFMYATRGRYVYEGDRALYGDDMGCQQFFSDPNYSIMEKITDKGANKIRYITNILMLIAWKIIGTDYEMEDTILFFCNVLLIAVVWVCSYSILRFNTNENSIKTQIQNIFLASAGALVFASSRFAYYSYEEVFGIMENTGSALCLIIITLLIIDKFKYGVRFWIAYILWIVSYYVHERYLLLLGVLFLYTFFGFIYKKQRYRVIDFIRQVLIILSGILVFVQRVVVFGNRALDGTGGTSMKETFDIGTILSMVERQVFYLFGFNPPNDAYLNGIRFQDVNKFIVIWTVCILLLISVVAVFFICKVKKPFFEKYYPIFLCIISILCIMISCSFTIRVEMRWLYASFGLEVICLLYMIHLLLMERSEVGVTYFLRTIILFIVISIPMIETYYVCHWDRIYNQSFRSDSMNLSDELDEYDYIDNLYLVITQSSPLGIEGITRLAEAEGVKINSIKEVYSFKDIGELSENDAVFLRDSSEKDYVDITEQFYHMDIVSGRYEDAWVEPYVKAEGITGNNAGLYVAIYIPDYELIGGEGKIDVLFNGEKCGEIYVKSNWYGDAVIYGLNKGRNKIELISDFWCVENSGRSEDGRMSFVLSDFKIVYE